MCVLVRVYMCIYQACVGAKREGNATFLKYVHSVTVSCFSWIKPVDVAVGSKNWALFFSMEWGGNTKNHENRGWGFDTLDYH